MIQSLPTLAHCPREKGEGRRKEEKRKGERDGRRERTFKPLFQADSLAHTDLY